MRAVRFQFLVRHARDRGNASGRSDNRSFCGLASNASARSLRAAREFPFRHNGFRGRGGGWPGAEVAAATHSMRDRDGFERKRAWSILVEGYAQGRVKRSLREIRWTRFITAGLFGRHIGKCSGNHLKVVLGLAFRRGRGREGNTENQSTSPHRLAEFHQKRGPA